MAKKKWFKWVVEIQVDRSWVEDGYDLDDERAHEMLSKDLHGAFGHEIKTKVVSTPDRFEILKAQGYTGKEARQKIHEEVAAQMAEEGIIE